MGNYELQLYTFLIFVSLAALVEGYKFQPLILYENVPDHCKVWKCCNHSVCNMRPPTAPVLFTMLHGGGNGYKTLGMINSIALAYAHGFNFGGLIAFKGNEVTHGVHFKKLVSSLFDPALANTIIVDEYYNTTHPPRFTLQFQLMDQIVALKKQVAIKEALVYNAPIYKSMHEDMKANSPEREYMMTKFHAMFEESGRDDSMLQDLIKSPIPVVAMHVRRGDMGRNDVTLSKFIECSKDEFFYDILVLIKKFLADVDVHLFSSLEKSKTETSPWTTKDFDGYRERGMKVHFDEVNVPTTLKFLALASVTVIESRSSFARTAAHLARGCVIDISCGEPRVLSSKATGKLEKDLKKCLHMKKIISK
eukprot:m.21818 g.21818  ORF g.21818 m.21818 type:complete len:364 (+) comp7236_c0_seq1:317-1408(+)